MRTLFCTLMFAAALMAAPKADLNAKTLNGEKVHLKDLRGSFVVLNFWATWCMPCREELPMLVKVAQQSAKPDLHFIAVSVDDAKTRAAITESVARYGIQFPVWTGATGDDVYRLSKGEAVPATIFIDRDGTIQSIVSGQIREPELLERLAWLTGDRNGTPPLAFVSHVK